MMDQNHAKNMNGLKFINDGATQYLPTQVQKMKEK